MTQLTKIAILSFLLFLGVSSFAYTVEVRTTSIVLNSIETTVEIVADSAITDSVLLNFGPQSEWVLLKEGKYKKEYTFSGKTSVSVIYKSKETTRIVNPIPLWVSVLPPILAILLALIFKEVISSLFLGIFLGTFIISWYQVDSIWSGIGNGFLRIVDTYIVQSLYDHDHLAIIVFSMLIGSMVSLITKNGGMQGVVNRLLKYAKSAQSGQFITWFLGIAIFFDDYANTLVVGNTMRPITDKLKISRQKLAYLVDSTAAPVASIAIITTWIGAELSYIQSGIEHLEIGESAFSVFIHSLQFSYYPILTLVFMFMLVKGRRDFGPMYTYEKEARISIASESVNEDVGNNSVEQSEVKPRSYNALIPILVLIGGTLVGLFYTGYDASVWNNQALSFFRKLSLILGNANSYDALLWSSFGAVFVAFALSVTQKILTVQKAAESVVDGFKAMLPAIVILILAWSLALITKHLHTADFFSQLLISLHVSAYLVPVLTFILAAMVAFSTGTSWGTMAILYPLILPTAWILSKESGLDYQHTMIIFSASVANVLAGAVLGDHCSPISDTTILSSLASSCPHITHVKTQMPYALTVGIVAAFVGILPASFGVPFYVLLPISIGLLYLIIRLVGKRTD